MTGDCLKYSWWPLSLQRGNTGEEGHAEWGTERHLHSNSWWMAFLINCHWQWAEMCQVTELTQRKLQVCLRLGGQGREEPEREQDQRQALCQFFQKHLTCLHCFSPLPFYNCGGPESTDLKNILYLCTHVWVCVCVCIHAKAHVRRSEDNLWSYDVGPLSSGHQAESSHPLTAIAKWHSSGAGSLNKGGLI